jgi:hypothetical protein
MLTSGYRSTEKQKALWDDALQKNGGDVAKTRKLVAPPGLSFHEKGLAVDLNKSDTGPINEAAKMGLLAKYGLYRPLANEDWHVEPVGSRKGALAKAPVVGDGVNSPAKEPTSVPAPKKVPPVAQTIKASEVPVETPPEDKVKDTDAVPASTNKQEAPSLTEASTDDIVPAEVDKGSKENKVQQTSNDIIEGTKGNDLTVASAGSSSPTNISSNNSTSINNDKEDSLSSHDLFRKKILT